MSETYIKYSALEDAVTYASKARGKMDEYISQIGKVINTPIGRLQGDDSCGYAQSAANLANNKVSQLLEKKTYFSNFERTAQNLIDTARQTDNRVAENISNIAEQYIEKRTWYEAAGDWIYNTFCVDLANRFSLVRDFVDGLKWIWDKAGNIVRKIHNWFKYGDGKYVWNIMSSIVKAVIAISGTIKLVMAAVAAIVAIPVTGGLSLPIVLACIGAVAASIATVITIGNSITTLYTNGKALSLSGDPLDDDDGDPGAARYYGDATKMSSMFQKTDLGDEKTNAAFQTAGEVIDTTKMIADTTSVVCNIASLGNVRDFRVTTQKHNINYRINEGKWNKGYSFTYQNIKKNILHDMGYKTSAGGFKKGSFGIKLKSSDDVKDYTIHFKNSTFSCPERLVKFFNGAKTIDNSMNFAQNVDGLYDFYTDSDKTFSDFAKGLENLSGIGGKTKAFSVVNKYITKPIKQFQSVKGEIDKHMPETTIAFAGAGGGGGR